MTGFQKGANLFGNSTGKLHTRMGDGQNDMLTARQPCLSDSNRTIVFAR